MTGRFDDVWSSAPSDGASCWGGILAPRSVGAEVDQIMTAWYHECAERIECDLQLDQAHELLDQAQALIRQFLIDGEIRPESRKQAFQFLRDRREAGSPKKGFEDR